jgi:mRNA interferase RelE/StbE
MSYFVEIDDPVERKLLRMPSTVILRFRDKLALLEQNPRPPGCILLHGKENKWRLRVGKYRLVYRIFDDIQKIIVFDFDLRDKVYKDES